MHPKYLSIADFSYDLPDEHIAHHPLPERDASKLLIYKNGSIQEDTYKHIADHLPADSLLVFNNTKVVAARLLFQKSTGGQIEIFCLEPHEQYGSISNALQQQGKVFWQCLVGGASKWKHGQVLERTIDTTAGPIQLQAVYTEKRAGSFVIELSWSPATLSFAELLQHAGAIPLPPYIKRKATDEDEERYQTIFAQFEGSVAAPTAGLHFTETVFKELEKKGIQKEFVTLHVGAGTFKPVKSSTMEEHDMHAEFIDVSIETIQQLANAVEKSITPVGTTSLRTLESIYWLGVKLLSNKGSFAALPELEQWEAYDLTEQTIPAAEALNALLLWMEKNQQHRLFAKTRIIIAPGYKPRVAKALITNFHQPQSTLLLLIAALVGEDWRNLYDYALQRDFRFLSYGDGCLLFVEDGEW